VLEGEKMGGQSSVPADRQRDKTVCQPWSTAIERRAILLVTPPKVDSPLRDEEAP
jgi:hypothetical protein